MVNSASAKEPVSINPKSSEPVVELLTSNVKTGDSSSGIRFSSNVGNAAGTALNDVRVHAQILEPYLHVPPKLASPMIPSYPFSKFAFKRFVATPIDWFEIVMFPIVTSSRTTYPDAPNSPTYSTKKVSPVTFLAVELLAGSHVLCFMVSLAGKSGP